MKYLLVVIFIFSAACSYVVVDTRSPEVASATQTARVPIEATAIVLATEEAPQVACDIKGNIAADGEKIYHLPGGVYYDRVKVDLAQGDAWLCSEESAVHGGFRRSSR